MQLGFLYTKVPLDLVTSNDLVEDSQPFTSVLSLRAAESWAGAFQMKLTRL
jgi:hypothetical protein